MGSGPGIEVEEEQAGNAHQRKARQEHCRQELCQAGLDLHRDRLDCNYIFPFVSLKFGV